MRKIIGCLLIAIVCISQALAEEELPRDFLVFWPSGQYNMQPTVISTARVTLKQETSTEHTAEEIGWLWTRIEATNVRIVLSPELSERLSTQVKEVNLRSIKCEVHPTEYPIADKLYAYKTLMEGIMKRKLRFQPLPIGVSASRCEIAMHGRDPIYLFLAPISKELEGNPENAILDAVKRIAPKEFQGLSPSKALEKRWLDSGGTSIPRISFDPRVDASVIRANDKDAANFFRDFGSP